MVALLTSQFFSAMADNMLFVLVLALLTSGGQAGMLPLAQGAFVLAFILLAPFVGPFADSQPKGQVLLMANAVKLAGAGFILVGGPALIGYAIVGMGAAAYSPAKFGVLTQFFGPAKLVKANGLLEGSTIVAILLGVVAGGWLAATHLLGALALTATLYLVAMGLSLLIPRLAIERPIKHAGLTAFLRAFWGDVLYLVQTPATRFSLVGSGLFWGFGATLRLLLFAWVPAALLIDGPQAPANLMGAVSVGIVLGAVAASMLIKLERVARALFGGILLGPLIIALAFQDTLVPSLALLAVIGFAGGVFAIPLNALIQECGHQSIGAGRTLAVQNLIENCMMLGMVGVYYLVVDMGMDPQQTAAIFGVGMTLGIGWLVISRHRLLGSRASRLRC
jgi:LPLT family lysophospholipid transporter-like MFS transporter